MSRAQETRIFRTFASLVLAAQLLPVSARAVIRNALCTQVGATRYRIEFTADRTTKTVRVLASPAPSGADSRVIATVHSSPFEVDAGRPGERVYFQLAPDHGTRTEVSIRHLPLQGARNMRDLGGYRTATGQMVGWGLIYRADELGHLTDQDLRYLQHLHVRVVCDFRTKDERARLPDRWPETPEAESVWNPLSPGKEGDNTAVVALQRVLANDPEPAQVERFMADIYRQFAIDGSGEFRNAFREIVSGKVPFLYHCTAGKDRTGLFSAFLLLTLGVPREIATEDYLLSNQYTITPDAISRLTKMMADAAPNSAPISPEVARILLGVHRNFLDAALNAIEERYGSFEAYRREALGLSDADVAELKTQLLIP